MRVRVQVIVEPEDGGPAAVREILRSVWLRAKTLVDLGGRRAYH